jgi:hypothetical protein
MADAVKKYPSRIRYEENNPTVSFRIPIEQLEQLNKVRDEQGVSYKDLILAGAGMLEKDRTRALKKVRIGTCSACGEPIDFDLTSKKEIDQLAETLSEVGWYHDDCVP